MSTPIEEIKSRLDIVDVVHEYVPLKPAGSSWKARCPFHNEKTPSFMVSRERGSWHCFGCNRGGDVISFVQEMEGLEFPETLRLLAKRAGVELKSFDPKLQTQKTKVLNVLLWVSRYWQEVLRKSADAEPARQYLKQRGLKEETIDDFGLGFAPTGWDVTYQALKKKGFADDDIFQAGLTIKKDRGVGFYDRFRARIMFPIRDVHGTVVGFTGRILEALVDPKSPPPAKYVNSPQTIAYNKSQVLYGLDLAKTAIKKSKLAVVVEGNMDCLMSHQAGINNVIAVSGTALTAEQVKLLKRFTDHVAFCFDQDQAGIDAVVRGVEQALQAEITTTIIHLPFGKDPAEVIAQDPAAWTTAAGAGRPVMEYFFARAQAKRDLTKVEDKKSMAKELLPIIALISNTIEQTHYLQSLADLLRVDEAALRSSFTRTRPPAAAVNPEKPVDNPPAMTDRFRQVSERLVALLIKQPKFIDQLAASFEDQLLVGSDLQSLYKTLAIGYTGHHLTNQGNLAGFTSKLEPDQRPLADLLSMLGDKEYAEATAAAMEHDLLELTIALKRRALSQELQRLEIDMRQIEQRPGRDAAARLKPLVDRFQELAEQLRALG